MKEGVKSRGGREQEVKVEVIGVKERGEGGKWVVRGERKGKERK